MRCHALRQGLLWIPSGFEGLHVSNWGIAGFHEVFGNSRSHGRILHYKEVKLFVTRKTSSLFLWHSISKSFVFTPGEETTLRMSVFARNRNVEWSVVSLFLGRWCHKGMSQLCSCTFLWKQYCFLKLSQTKSFKAFSGTADLPVTALLPKRFLEAEGYKEGQNISWTSWKGPASSSTILSEKVWNSDDIHCEICLWWLSSCC